MSQGRVISFWRLVGNYVINIFVIVKLEVKMIRFWNAVVLYLLNRKYFHRLCIDDGLFNQA